MNADAIADILRRRWVWISCALLWALAQYFQQGAAILAVPGVR